MTKRIPAIPTDYNGITFRSKLEAKYAKAFDSLNIPWVYEEVNFEFDDGTRYAPDFYFPDHDQFFEVKGVMTPRDEHKINQLVLSGHTTIVGNSQGKLVYYHGKPYYDIPLDRKWPGFHALCKHCGSYTFLGLLDDLVCAKCGTRDNLNFLEYLNNIGYGLFNQGDPYWFLNM